MGKYYFLLIAILLSGSGFSQEDKKEARTFKESTWSARINAIALADAFTFPTLQLSVEKKITPKYSIVVEGGYQLYDFALKTDTIFKKPRGGYKASIEFRAYVLKIFNPNYKLRRGELFAGIQPFLRQDQYNGSIRYYKIADLDADVENPVEYNDSYGVKRKVYGINLTSGYQINMGRNFIFEPAIGIGYLYRKIQNTNLQYKPDTDDRGIVEWAQGNDLYTSTGATVNLFAAVRFGYKL